MTRIAIAIPVTRRALIDDRHQCHAESDDADTPREEGLEAPPRQEVDIGRKPLSGLPIDRMGKSLRKPVDNRKSRMHLDGEAPIRRRDEDTAPDPDRLGYELLLALASADVLDDGVRKDDVERAVASPPSTSCGIAQYTTITTA